MKSMAQEGRDGWSARGPNSADTSTDRLTGVEGTWRAKCTRSMMNRLGPVIGIKRPFGSCIHAPRREHAPRTARREIGSARDWQRNGNRSVWEVEDRECAVVAPAWSEPEVLRPVTGKLDS